MVRTLLSIAGNETADQRLALGRRIVARQYVTEVMVEASLRKTPLLSGQGEAVITVVAKEMRSQRIGWKLLPCPEPCRHLGVFAKTS